MNEATTLMISMAKPSQLNCFFSMFLCDLSKYKKNPILNRYLNVKNRTREEKTIKKGYCLKLTQRGQTETNLFFTLRSV